MLFGLLSWAQLFAFAAFVLAIVALAQADAKQRPLALAVVLLSVALAVRWSS